MERLSLERIKAAILHPDKKVRNTVLLYFEHSRQTDATIMPLVTQAYDRFGDEAFESHWILPDLPQTMDTVAWLLQTIERVEAGTKINQTSSFASSIIGCLLCAEPTLLDYHATSIQALRHLDAQSKTRLKNRLAAYAMPYEKLWQNLFCICEFFRSSHRLPFIASSYCYSIVKALARYPEQSSAQVLEMLADGSLFTADHLEGFVMQLIGKLRLNAAVPWLMHEYSIYSTYSALARIGSEDVVWEIMRGFEGAKEANEEDEEERSMSLFLLGDIHTDFSVRAALELAREEAARLKMFTGYADVQADLLGAAVLNFAPCAIEPTRQYILGHDNSDLHFVRGCLLRACQIMDVTFPEYEDWLAVHLQEEARLLRVDS